MKEIIYLAEQFLKIAKLGHFDKDMRKIGVIHTDILGEDLEGIQMGRVYREFNIDGNKLTLPDGIYFNEKARNELIEEYTLKLKELRSVIEFNRNQRIDDMIEAKREEIQKLEEQRNLIAA